MTATHPRAAPRLIAIAAALTALHAPSWALDYVWQGGTGLWGDSSKWTLLGVPGAGDSATLNSSNALVSLNDTRSLGSLILSNGYLGGSGVLNTGSASFVSAGLGLSGTAEGVLNISGNALFNGSSFQALRYGHIVNLNGNTSWSAGNGRIEVDPGFAGNSNTNPYGASQLNIGAGTTFTDAGAAAAAGSKTLGYSGGQINNAGTYVRNGQGTTVASYGFNNTGTLQVNAGTFSLVGNSTLRGTSSGTVNVAPGAVFNLGDADITAGSIANAGKVTLTSSSVTTVAAAASIDGAWEINHSSAQLYQAGNHSIGSLALTDGYLGGPGVLNTGTASFGGAYMGWSAAEAGGVLNVNGSASFAGASVLTLRHGQVLNLNGNTSWSAGNGRIGVEASFAGNNSTAAHGPSQLNIGAGTTFTDAGAAAAAGSKTLGYSGGQVNNAGTYVRNGLGTTVASYGFHNTGTLQVNGGTFSLDGNSNLRGASSGTVNVAPGAVFNLGDADITAGSIANAGKVTMTSGSVATIAAAASINGAWELTHNSAQLYQAGNHSISSLALTDGYLGGPGVLNAGTASFGGAVLGWSAAEAGGVLNVSGSASFAGASVLTLRHGQVLNLNGNTTWTAGNGRIEVEQGFAGNNTTAAHGASQLNIAAGTTFTDAGAAAAAGSKTLGYSGGQVNNAGTYVRNGLGTTVASYGFNNTGTLQVNAGTLRLDGNSNLRSVSSGTVNVAPGAVFNLGDADITAGSIANAGKVTLTSSSVATIAAAASINGAWELTHGSAQLFHAGNHSISSLALTAGYLGGPGVLNTGSASFGGATLGWSTAEAGGVLNVNGPASFNGASTLTLRHGQVVTLQGNTSWGAGNGRIEVAQGFAGNSNTAAHGPSQLNIGAGTTFTDAGAAAAAGIKQIGYAGGQINNAGTYVRNGLGSTVALGFNNTGLLQLQGGVFTVTGSFSNAGDIQIAAGAELDADSGTTLFANAGTLQGHGTVRTANASSALLNNGLLLAGSAGGLGQLSVVGDLTLGNSSVLGVDLGQAGQHDLLAISSDLFVDGTLQVQGVGGYLPQVGDSFVIATFAGNRVAGSQFDALQWQGAGQVTLVADYNAHDITLRVTEVTAVPEPETWLMLLGGLAALGAQARRRGPAQRRRA